MKLAIYNKGIPFDGATIASRPLGGSESSIIYMARELERCGHSVTVYANCSSEDATYRHYHRFFADYRKLPWDAVIAFRSFDPMLLGRIAPRMIFWTGDAYDQPSLADFGHRALQDNIDLVFCVSTWHRNTFIERFNLPSDKVVATRNGFAAELVRRDPHRTIESAAYTSTPFRGLKILLDMFPEIRRRVPTMTLDVFSSMRVYGWGADQDREAFGDLYEAAEQPGVVWRGSVAQPELLERLASTGLLLYPNTFEETSCIAAIEAQASGCVVVTSASAGLNETVINGETGICLKGDPHSTAYRREFIEAACSLANNPDNFRRLSESARARAFREYTWSAIAGEWTNIFSDMPARPLTGRLAGPLSLLERVNEYVRTGKHSTAKSLLLKLEDTPFFANEIQNFKDLIGEESHGRDYQRDSVSSPA